MGVGARQLAGPEFPGHRRTAWGADPPRDVVPADSGTPRNGSCRVIMNRVNFF